MISKVFRLKPGDILSNGPLDPFCILQSRHVKSFHLFDVCSRFVSANINVPEHSYMESPSFVGIKGQLQMFCRSMAALRASPARTAWIVFKK